METDQHLDAATEKIVQRARDRFQRHRQRTLVGVDRFFIKLFLGQWLFAILMALVFSPYGWEGKVQSVHLHVWIALLLGGAIVSFPIALALRFPGRTLTRHVIAVAQMLSSALLIHLSGGRIETHFHVFGSLAILAFYLDWKVLVTAAITVALDHFLRGILWPESVYGIVNPEWWRFLEHGFWVVFCVAFLIASCRRQIREWLSFAEEGGMIEALAESEWRAQSVLDRDREQRSLEAGQ
jgi:two-component system, NtrC family, sensor histidine kinase HydH